MKDTTHLVNKHPNQKVRFNPVMPTADHIGFTKHESRFIFSCNPPLSQKTLDEITEKVEHPYRWKKKRKKDNAPPKVDLTERAKKKIMEEFEYQIEFERKKKELAELGVRLVSIPRKDK